MQNTIIRDLTKGSVPKLLLHFSFPFMLSNALQTIYNLVDMVVVGQFVGSSGLSAVSISGMIVWLLCCIAIGYSSGGQIYLSQLIGAGNTGELCRAIGTIFSTVFVFSILATFIGIVFHQPLLLLLNTPEEAYSQACDYALISSIGMFFVYGYNTVSAILRGMGDSKRPFYFIAISASLNVVLDLLFVGPLHMQAAGAALATILSQAVSFIISIIYLYMRRESFGFDFRPSSFIPDKNVFISLSKLGLPLTVQSTAINVSMLYVSAGINSYGLVFSSVYGIGGRLQSIMFIITNSISTASASMFGQNLGAGKHNRVRQIFWSGNLICMAFFLIIGTLCLLFPQQIFSLFTRDSAVIKESPRFMITLVVMFLGFATMTAGVALLNGIGHGTLSLITALLDGVIVRIGLCLLLSAPLGVWGYFWGNALAGFVSTLIGFIYFFSGSWRHRKLMFQ